MSSTDGIASALSSSSILPQLAPQLSRHLLFPLLEFEENQADQRGDAAAVRDIQRAKMSLLERTNMTDYVANLYCQINGIAHPPAEFDQRRQAVIADMERLEADTLQISNLLMREEVVSSLRSDKVANLEYLKNEHGVRNLMSFPVLPGLGL